MSPAMAGLFEIKSKIPDVERGINRRNINNIPIDISMIIF
jgi:hypothetical protein